MSDNDTIRFSCPHCEKRLRVNANLAGKRIRCPNKDCAKPVEVPSPLEDELPLRVDPNPPRSRRRTWIVRGGAAACLVAGVVFVIAMRDKERTPAQNEVASVTQPDSKAESKFGPSAEGEPEPKPEPKAEAKSGKSSKLSIIGKWESKDPNDGQPVTFEFKADGTAAMKKGDLVSPVKKYRFDETKKPHHLDLITGMLIDDPLIKVEKRVEFLAQFERPHTLKISGPRRGVKNSNRPEKFEDGEISTLVKLSDVSPPSEKTEAADSLTPAGTWTGVTEGPVRVEKIVIERNEFPCPGTVVLRWYGKDPRGQTVFDHAVTWTRKNGELIAHIRQEEGIRMIEPDGTFQTLRLLKDSEPFQLAQVNLVGPTLSGTITQFAVPAGSKKELKFTSLSKKK